MGTFQQRIKQLEERIGGGKLIGKVIVDQPYAKYQHERLDLRHSKGKAKYLHDPLFAEYQGILTSIAKNTLRGDQSKAMVRGMDKIVSGVFKQAPREMGDLRFSGHARVIDRGKIVYDRTPIKPRLSKSALKAKGRIRPSNRRRKR